MTPRPEACPRGLFRYRGALRPRRQGWVVRLNRLCCPDGHALTLTRNLSEAGYLECDHRAHGASRDDGAYVYVFIPPAFGGARRVYALDVTGAERDWFNDQGMSFDDILRWLDAEFPDARQSA
jgi:hypothetical protein